MGKYLKLLVYMSLVCLWAQADIDSEKFESQFEWYREHTSETPSVRDVHAHKDTVFVFVTGIAGEYIPLYWADAKKEIERLTGTRREKDPAKKRVFVYKPSSLKTVAQNSIGLKNYLDQILTKVGPSKKIMLIGHSMGATESWTAMMKNPDFLKERLNGAIFLQGPFLGSPLANHIVEGKDLNSVQHWTVNPPLFAVRWGMLKAYSVPLIRPALESITTGAATQHTLSIQSEFDRAFDSEAQAKTLFVATEKAPLSSITQIRHPLDIGMNVCINALNQISPGPNDGLVELRSQRPPGIKAESRTIFAKGIHHGGVGNTGLGKAFSRTLFGVKAQ